MRAGPLRHRIEIQHRVASRDSDTGEYGEAVWQPFARVWSQISPLSARDFIAAKAAQSEATARIVIRYRDGVLPTMRIIYRDEIYSIVGPPLADPDSGLDYLTILTSKGVKDG
ncbi:phage head closure protein [Pseudomonas qingdaonensis]|uniref:phage head closure protein n=1 Tax=Pseudomonas qingdaonensis TaxID=2056231 RepID=UPI0028A7F8BD|nr:phage head closure protein [Pseudomonas qingdaonensis]